jgi:hypothetical protein
VVLSGNRGLRSLWSTIKEADELERAQRRIDDRVVELEERRAQIREFCAQRRTCSPERPSTS